MSAGMSNQNQNRPMMKPAGMEDPMSAMMSPQMPQQGMQNPMLEKLKQMAQGAQGQGRGNK